MRDQLLWRGVVEKNSGLEKVGGYGGSEQPEKPFSPSGVLRVKVIPQATSSLPQALRASSLVRGSFIFLAMWVTAENAGDFLSVGVQKNSAHSDRAILLIERQSFSQLC